MLCNLIRHRSIALCLQTLSEVLCSDILAKCLYILTRTSFIQYFFFVLSHYFCLLLAFWPWQGYVLTFMCKWIHICLDIHFFYSIEWLSFLSEKFISLKDIHRKKHCLIFDSFISNWSWIRINKTLETLAYVCGFKWKGRSRLYLLDRFVLVLVKIVLEVVINVIAVKGWRVFSVFDKWLAFNGNPTSTCQ